MADLVLDMPNADRLRSALGGNLFRNLESYPGQVWTTPPLMSARQEGKRSRREIVRAAREVERYSEHIRGGIDRKADMVVGPRLMVRATPDFDTLGITDPAEQAKVKKSFEREFKNWAYDARLLQDAEGHYDFGGLAWLMFRGITGPDAECAAVVHYEQDRADAYRHRWATFVEVYDPDRIETPPDKVGNPNVREGFVFDKWNRRVGTFVRKSHPSDAIDKFSDMDFELVPRETEAGRPVGINWFVKTRAGQIRGLSTLVTILKQSNMLDKFDDAYLSAATLNQVLATYIESPASTEAVAQNLAPAGNAADAWSMFENKLSYYDRVKMRVGGARIPVMPPGDKITMEGVNRAAQDPSFFRNSFLRGFASSIGISFEQIAKNFSDANYSAARAALLDVWQGIMRLRFWFGQHVLALIYGAVIEEAWKKGRVYIPAGTPNFDEYRTAWCACLWTGPGFPQIDPEKEAKASKMLLEMKIESREEVIAQRGRDIEDVFDEIQNERAMAEERDFMLDPLAPGTPGAEEATIDPDGGGTPKKQPKSGSSGQRDGDGDGVVDEENQ
jgi:lambda family phage portal protein